MVSGLGDAKGREEKEDSVCAVLGISYWKISKIVRRMAGKEGKERTLVQTQMPMLLSLRNRA